MLLQIMCANRIKNKYWGKRVLVSLAHEIIYDWALFTLCQCRSSTLRLWPQLQIIFRELLYHVYNNILLTIEFIALDSFLYRYKKQRQNAAHSNQCWSNKGENPWCILERFKVLWHPIFHYLLVDVLERLVHERCSNIHFKKI